MFKGEQRGRAPLAIMAGLVLLVMLPVLLGSYQLHVVNLVLVSIITAIGLNFVTGLTGQISLCHAAFAGISAYTMTLLAIKYGVPFWVGWPLGAFAAALVGYAIGIPALRLEGHYLALATLGFGEILLLANVHLEWLTNGPNGLVVPAPRIGGFSIESASAKYFLVLTTAIVAVIFAWNIHRSKMGRTLMAIQDSSTAAQAVGVHLAHYKTLTFALGSFYAGISGGLYAVVVGFVTPYEFGLWPSLWVLTMVVVGGRGYLVGAILGAIVITALPEVLRDLQDYQELIYGVLLLSVLIYKPSGLYGLMKPIADFFVGQPSGVKHAK